MYDHDPEDVAALGWEEFIARQWESIFVGYRARARRRPARWRHAGLLSFVRGYAFGTDGAEPTFP